MRLEGDARDRGAWPRAKDANSVGDCGRKVTDGGSVGISAAASTPPGWMTQPVQE